MGKFGTMMSMWPSGVNIITMGIGLDVKQPIQQCHALVFMLDQDMGIGVQSKGHGCFAQDHGGIHLLLHRTGREGMPQCVEGEVRQAYQLKYLTVVVLESTWLYISVQLVLDQHASIIHEQQVTTVRSSTFLIHRREVANRAIIFTLIPLPLKTA